MQPRPGSGRNSGSSNYGRVVNPRGPQVDPQPVKKTPKPPKKASSKKDSRLARAGVSGFNKPKRTPSHPTKSHVVVAKEGSQVKTIRFGQQGVTGDRKPSARQASFKARHAKNIAKGKMSAAYWADKVKW
jgi:hypothetical protein